MSRLCHGNTRLLRLKFVYIFSVPTVGLYVYRSCLFGNLTGLFIVDVGSNVRDKFAQFFIVDVGSHVGLC
jgi:hypothetical protein